MTTLTLSPVVAAPTVGFGRLFRVELRKMLDTRAAAWLLGSVLVLTLLASLLPAVAAAPSDANTMPWSDGLQAATMALTLLVPVIGVWSATQEWTHRTALTTFALEPRRLRVLVAKILATLVVSLVAFVAALAWSVLLAVTLGRVLAVTIDWTPTPHLVLGLLLATVFSVLQGLALGTAVMNTPGALAVYFLAPPALGILGTINDRVHELTSWINPQLTLASLMGGDWANAPWAKVGVGIAVWVVVPLAIGAYRTVRREVK